MTTKLKKNKQRWLFQLAPVYCFQNEIGAESGPDGIPNRFPGNLDYSHKANLKQHRKGSGFESNFTNILFASRACAKN